MQNAARGALLLPVLQLRDSFAFRSNRHLDI
jgi:hypothetical protein